MRRLCKIVLLLLTPLMLIGSFEENNCSDPLVANLTTVWTGDFDQMIERRFVRVLVISSEIMYWVDQGKKSGLVYELMMMFEKELNKRYRLKNRHMKMKVVLIPVSKAKLIPALIEGRGDIVVAEVSVTPRRSKKVDFSDPFISNIKVIVVTGPSSPPVKTMENLSGKEIYVQHASRYKEILEEMNVWFAKNGKEPIKIRIIPDVLESKEILEMVNAGLIEATIIYDYQAKLWSKVLPDLVLHENIVLEKDDSFSWMVRKHSPLLLDEVNHFIKKHKAGTLLGNILIKRYVQQFQFSEPALTQSKIEAFEKVVGIFKKYARQYELNYLLMIAQAYQESKLNQRARSRVGAIGMMQLMPTTGREMRVGDIRNLEANIHAGIKYHRLILDRYFNDESMDALNRTLFTFAAYNAGPARIRKLRKIAQKRGYDPNIWFDNVEVIAAEKIGAETVSYVANIYEYYVAYYLYEQEKLEKEKVWKRGS